MTKHVDARHHFCVYVGDHTLHNTDSFHSTDADLAHRLHRVLRLRAGNTVQLFNDTHHALLTLQETKNWKREVIGSITDTTATTLRTPALHVGIGMLKSAALEQAVYAASAAGASSITPIITSKSRNELSDRERERLRMQLIAACEQSKNVQLPQLHSPITLEKFLASESHTRCWFDGSGSPLPVLINDLAKFGVIPACPESLRSAKSEASLRSAKSEASLRSAKSEASLRSADPGQARVTHRAGSISLLIGAEAGFTSAEEALIKTHNWPAYCLTPTVLRAVEAITVATSVVSGTVF